MLEVKGNQIKLTKGDTACLHVDLRNADGSAYTMGSGDTLTMTVRKRPGSAILLQQVSTGTEIHLSSSKTAGLEVGSCCYDIELHTAAGGVYTVVGLNENAVGNMIVMEEVTT